MNNKEKGNFGYIDHYKKNTAIIGFASLAMVFIIFFTGIIIYRSNRSFFSILAAVSMLPAARYLVSFFVVMKYHSSDRAIYDELAKNGHNGLWRSVDDDTMAQYSENDELPEDKCGATLISDTIFTYDKAIMNVDYIAIYCGNVIAYSDYKGLDAKYTEQYIKKILDNSCNYKSLCFFTESSLFLKAYDEICNKSSSKNARELTNDMIIARKLLPYSI